MWHRNNSITRSNLCNNSNPLNISSNNSSSTRNIHNTIITSSLRGFSSRFITSSRDSILRD